MSSNHTTSNKRVSGQLPWSLTARAVISVILIAHFALLALNYVSNNSMLRSDFSDQTLVAVQPYTITLGWYTEFAPIALATGENFDRAMKIEYKTSRRDTKWETWINSKRANPRWRRLVALAGAWAETEDSDGLGLVAAALVTHAAKDGIQIQRIRFAVNPSADGQQPDPIYEASVVKLTESDITLVPKIEPTRSVPVTPTTEGAGS